MDLIHHPFYTPLFRDYFENIIINTAINKDEVFLLHYCLLTLKNVAPCIQVSKYLQFGFTWRYF